jgi:hypothetical protein
MEETKPVKKMVKRGVRPNHAKISKRKGESRRKQGKSEQQDVVRFAVPKVEQTNAAAE